MLITSLLTKKRDGHALTDDEIRFLVDGFCQGAVADAQMAAWAMAVCIRSMDDRETTTLTTAMLESGERLSRAVSRDQPRVDKHSTGGLGDKVSLILAPLLAACDVQVPMISGRGLGITGGTLDKLESIEGLRTDLSSAEADRILQQVGSFIMGANQQIAPADRRLYALRDVTGTVESVPLITASILSKKLAANLDALVLDVKTGSGAFMQREADAIELAESLVRIGGAAGLPTLALLTDMDQPLGWGVGNAIEVNEAVEVLQGGSGAVRELTIELGASLLTQVGVEASLEAARQRLTRSLDGGAALERFERLVQLQGGRLKTPLPLAPAEEITADRDGFLVRYDCRTLGEVVVELGGGRRQLQDRIDHRVGLHVFHRIGDRITAGEPLVRLHGGTAASGQFIAKIRGAISIADEAVDPPPLILRRLNENGGA